MQSNFAAARALLERAQEMLIGDDERSVKMREALDMLIEAALTAEHSQPPVAGNVVSFPGKRLARR
ncbi:hypothetical protein SAMN04488498_103387 [Mesorhizobium albiziae]|uniref:Uncharacterized protein n=1 Tax=Neomesorhizobium albiziae TaxID=335020 RepID=A0A1I3XMV5_9HYPH|nr:hypothetical protein [Mesorhizobium albiziae]GLS30302.1 hypothetical protein GCM10007937_20100 [Mesorhizobium albiziae]SFK20947.1 hypothetical protein SAMN04488498_103387 [Mesorhizobium albiziae]